MDLPRLEVNAPESPPHQISLNDPALTIGRHRSNRLVIPDERASRFHCVVEHTAEGFRLRDLHSKNGTKLNGERISSAYLKVGDSFRIGKTNFAFSVPEGYVLPPPPHPPKPDPQHAKKTPHSPVSVGSPVKAKVIHSRDRDDGVIPMPIDAPTPVPKMPGPATPMPSGLGAAQRASPVAAGLSFAQPFSPEHRTPAPAHLPPRSQSPAQPAGYYASPAPPPVGIPPHAKETPAPPASEVTPPPPAAAPPVQPLPPHLLAPVMDALRGFAQFDLGINPDAMLGDSHIIPVNVGRPLDQPTTQLHPNDPAAQPLYLFKQVALAAIRARASHILIEPRASGVTLRVRVDGSLIEVAQLSKPVADHLVALLRGLTNLAPHQGPGPTPSQEGRCRLTLPDRTIECRLSVTPSIQGVSLSLRLSDPHAIPQHLPDLGLPLPVTRVLSDVMRQPAGVVLVSGPAMAGVTTTLYAALRQLDLRQLHVISIESQIDTPIDGVTQVPYDDTQPATLGPMIRVALKQSPSALLVGDLPDHDAAQAVIHASDQGYLVLAGLHARDPFAALSRLLDLNIPARHVAANLKLIVSLRLVRLLCPHCKTQATPSPAQQQRLAGVGVPGATTYTGKGCARCFNTGYMLRRPLATAIVIDDVARVGIERATTTADLRAALPHASGAPFRHAADSLVAQGLTSFDEADRASA